jgi:nucleotide-binding universal stress UspA family protein
MTRKKVYILLNDYVNHSPVIDYGVRLAKALHAPAVLLVMEYIHPSPTPAPILGSGIPHPPVVQSEAVKERVRDNLHKLCTDARKIWKEVYVQVEVGIPISDTVELMAEKDPRLLIVERNNDLNTLNEWFGTFETKLAERIDVPVLVVPPDKEWKSMRKILYIMDADDAKIDNVKVLANLSKTLMTHIQVVMISEEANSEHEKSFSKLAEVLREILGYRDATFFRIFGKKKAEAVEDLVKSNAPDWLAFEKKNKNFFRRIFDDYNTRRLVLNSKVPVMVL